jgi:hypothetical protein
VDPTELTKQNPRLKFLLPIRNPLDCSLSIARIGIPYFYPDIEGDDIQSVLGSILEEIKWFIDLFGRDPDHFFYFYQDQVDAATLQKLATFLGLSPDERWLRESLSVYQLKRSYDYEPALKNYYKSKVEELFDTSPAVRQHLIGMVSAV